MWATYIEDSQYYVPESFALDAAGHLFIAGGTNSLDFPVIGPLAGLPGRNPGSYSSFVLELAADGSRVVFSLIFGKSIQDNEPGAVYAAMIAMRLDNQGGLYVAGNADGTALPTTPSAYLRARPDAGEDVFVFKLDTATDSLVYATLFGGSAEDELVGFDGRYSALQIDSAGDLYLAGYTVSTDFKVTPGSLESRGPLNQQIRSEAERQRVVSVVLLDFCGN